MTGPGQHVCQCDRCGHKQVEQKNAVAEIDEREWHCPADAGGPCGDDAGDAQ